MEKVKELTSRQAENIAEGVCDTMDATLMDIYKKIDEQARMGRLGMNYTAYMSSVSFDKIKLWLNKKGYLVNHIGNTDCIFSMNIFWHGIPF